MASVDGHVKARRVRRLKSQGESTWLEIVLAEGKNREIRRMLARLEHKVMRLKRTALGPIKLDRGCGELVLGEHRGAGHRTPVLGRDHRHIEAPLLDAGVKAGQIEIRPLETMMNHHSTQIFLRDLVVPASDRIGDEGRGFRYVIDSWNAERILIASESIGDGGWFVDRASRYANERRVFGRAIGANQGVQFPIAQAHADVRAAALMRDRAATLFDRDEPCGAVLDGAAL